MAQQYLYRSPTTPAGPGWVVDLGTQAVRLGDIPGLIMECELGAVGSSSLRFDDPTGTAGHSGDAIVGLKQFTVNELSADANNRRIFEGYIADRRYYRGTQGVSPSLRTQAARVIDMSLMDINSFLSFRVFRNGTTNGSNTSFNRPAETDVQRVTALLAVPFLSDTLFDNGLVSTASPVNMDAVDYSGQKPADVLNDCAQQSGKNFFVYYDEVANQFSLFYDFNDSIVYPAYDTNLKISNVLADVNLDANGVAIGPIWLPLQDAQLVRDPSRVIAGVLFNNGSNSVYETNLTTSYTYGFRDAVSSSSNLKTVAQTEARAARYLAENSTEDDRLTFTVKFPAAKVNNWKEGQYAPVKFSHLPGYEDYVNCRCLCRTVSQDEETDEFYNVKYEVTPMSSVSSPSGATNWQLRGVDYSGIPILPSDTVPGRLLVLMQSGQGDATDFPADVRMADDPPTPGHGSPNVPPFPDHAGWTVLGTATSDYTGMNEGGPDPFAGQIAGASYRFVGPSETTTAPVQVSTNLAFSSCAGWLWEFNTTNVPTIVGTKNRTNMANPGHATLPAVTAGHHGFAIFVFTHVDYGGPPYLVLPDTDNHIVQTNASNNNPLASPTVCDSGPHGWAVPWVVIVELPNGGTPGLTFQPICEYTSMNYCGVVIELPSDAVSVGSFVPTIPYPANQVGP